LGRPGKQLLDLAEQETTLKGKLSVVQSFIQELKTTPISNQLLDEALAFIEARKGQITVKHLLEKLTVNYKWLERNFHNYLGLTPKEYIRLQRFKHTYIDLIQSKCEKSLFNIAIDNGYYDTGHMLKDLKHFAGTTKVLL